MEKPRGLRARLVISVGAQLTGKSGGIVVSAVTAAYVAHKLGPEGFGRYALAIAYVALWGVLADPGLNIAVLKTAGGDEEALRYQVRVSLGVSIAYTIPIIVLQILLGVLLYSGAGRSVVVGIAVLSAAAALGYVTSSLTPLFQHHVVLGRLSWLDIAGRASTLVLSVGIIRTFSHPLLLLFVASAAMSALVSAITLQMARRYSANLLPIFDREETKPLATLALPVLANVVIFSMYNRADAFLLSVLASPAQIGVYVLAYRVAVAPMLVPGVISSSVLARLVAAPTREEYSELASRAFTATALAGTTIVACGVPFASAVMRLLAGPRFPATSSAVLQVLLLGVALSFPAAFAGFLLMTTDKQRALLLLSIVNLAVNVALNFVLIPAIGAKGSAIAFLFSEFVGATAGVVLARRAGLLRVEPRLLIGIVTIAAVTASVATPVADASDLVRAAAVLPAVLIAAVAATIIARVARLQNISVLPGSRGIRRGSPALVKDLMPDGLDES